MSKTLVHIRPDDRDIADVYLAIKSFKKAWGSVDPHGVFKQSVDDTQLWIMIPIEGGQVTCLIADCVPAVYQERYHSVSGFNKATIHAQSYKIKTGVLSTEWYSKVTCLIDEVEYPLGFIAARFQAEIWTLLHDILNYDGKFFENIISARMNVAS